MSLFLTLMNAIGHVLYWVLLQFYTLTGNFGWAIILLTVTAKLVLHPLVRKQIASVKRIRSLEPKVAELRERFKDNPKQFRNELAKLYRAHHLNPIGSLFSSALQIPLLAGLWTLFRRASVFVPAVGLARRVFRRLPSDDVSAIRSADKFLGVPLDATPNLPSILLHPAWLIVPIVVFLTTFWQQHAAAATPEQTRLLVVIMALAVGYFAMQFPFGMSIYWIVSSVASVAENHLIAARATSLPSEVVLPQRSKAGRKRRQSPHTRTK